MFVSGNGPVSLQSLSPLKKSRSESNSAGDKFETRGGQDWKPIKPSLTHEAEAPAHSSKGVLNSVLMLTLGIALTMGATGCASVATAHGAQSGRPQIVQVETHKQDSPPQTPAQQVVGQKKASAAYQVGHDLNKAGKDIKKAAQPALDKGKEVGQEIAKAGKDFGLGVAKEATSFWKGLTGK